MSYRRRASPLHAARAAASMPWCLSLAVAALCCPTRSRWVPFVVSLPVAGALAGVWRELRRAALFALTLALTVAVINALVARDGLTVIWRFGRPAGPRP